MRATARLASLMLAATILATPALAQTPRPSAPKSPAEIAIRAFFIAGGEWMSASQTFDSVTGSSHVMTLGGGADVVFQRRPFLRFSLEHASTTGMRGEFAPDGTFVPNGINEQVTMMPIEIGGGWRFASVPKKGPKTSAAPGHDPSKARRPQIVTPYLGVALVLLHYREYSPILDIENTSETFPGLAGFGGVDVRVAPAITLGVEGEYRTVPNAIGQAASSVGRGVGETNLGGLTVRVMFGVRLGR